MKSLRLALPVCGAFCLVTVALLLRRAYRQDVKGLYEILEEYR